MIGDVRLTTKDDGVMRNDSKPELPATEDTVKASNHVRQAPSAAMRNELMAFMNAPVKQHRERRLEQTSKGTAPAKPPAKIAP